MCVLCVCVYVWCVCCVCVYMVCCVLCRNEDFPCVYLCLDVVGREEVGVCYEITEVCVHGVLCAMQCTCDVAM